MTDLLVTHDGKFHADDVLAAGLLRAIFPDAELKRTRDAGVITSAIASGDAIVFDIGGAHDPKAGVFDHHHRNPALRDDGMPYSAFGLIWQHYGKEFLTSLAVEEALTDEVHAHLDRTFVYPIDCLDNGNVSPKDLGIGTDISLSALLENFNTYVPEQETADFDAAMRVGTQILLATVETTLRLVRAKAAVARAIAEQWGEPILLLEESLPFQEAIRETKADHILYVVKPRKSDWGINGVQIEPGSYALRRELPEAWAGLEDKALQDITGVPDAIFAHRGRWMACAATCRGALEMARLATETN